jgi:hypothetical protein
MFFKNISYPVLGLAVVALVLGLWSITQAVGETEVITACVSKSGALRLKGEEACKANESEVSWNVKGERGEKGEKGDKGDKGDKGEQGEPGEDAEKLPEELRPVISEIQMERGEKRIVLFGTAFENSFGALHVGFPTIAWGTLTLILPNGSTLQEKTNGFWNGLVFDFNESLPDGEIPFTLDAYLYWGGFLVPFPITEGVICSGNCVLYP